MSRYTVLFSHQLLHGGLIAVALGTMAEMPSQEFILTHPKHQEELTVWSERDAQEHRRQQYEKLKRELNATTLDAEHRDLLASALSWLYFGVPISSYQEQSEYSSRWDELTKEEASYSILDTGMVEKILLSVDAEADNLVRTNHIENVSTPFSHGGLVGLDVTSGVVHTESDTEITFRFDIILPEIEEQGEVPGFVNEVLQGLHLAAEYTVDKHSRTLRSVKNVLLKPFRKLFLFAIKMVEATVHYEYLEECSCMAVNHVEGQLEGSALFIGRVHLKKSAMYLKIQCEQPVRYLSHQGGAADVMSMLFD